MRIAIIGAGPSGMAQLISFAQTETMGAEMPEIVCFEKQEQMGGLWNFTWRTGSDKHGLPLHASMYRDLWTNAPKECLEFPGYSFDDHYGVPIPSYPPRSVLREYIVTRAKKHNIDRWIRYNTLVKHIDYDDKSAKFTVIARDLCEETERSESFDRLIVATGHFSAPHAPEVEGFETFQGAILHAHDFRDARMFEGKRVLVVGSSYSAEDIGSQCHKFGATEVVFCCRGQKIDWEWPESFSIKMNLTKVDARRAYFADASSKEIDAIILCTGYKVALPFLSDRLRIQTENRLWPVGLYKGTILMKNPKVAYVGYQNQFFTFTMFDAEAWFVRDVFLGSIAIPSAEEMQSDYDEWAQRESKLKSFTPLTDNNEAIDFQADFVRMLCDQTDYPSYDTKGVSDILKAWQREKGESILGYRDNCHRSIVTATLASEHPRKWMDERDESIGNFVKAAKK